LLWDDDDVTDRTLRIMQVAPRPSTFLPFGHGVHACPGNELAKLEMLVLIHHLVTGYRCVHLLSDPLHIFPLVL
jgi:cytochrome P450